MDITDFKIDQHSKESLHLQIAEQVRNLIAMEKLKPGDHLPPVRRLAEFLNINQNTILRAYLLLEQEQIVVARKRGGTVVTARTDDPKILVERRRRLSDMVGDDIPKALSMGYSPEDIEADFYRFGIIVTTGLPTNMSTNLKTQILSALDFSLILLARRKRWLNQIVRLNTSSKVLRIVHCGPP